VMSKSNAQAMMESNRTENKRELTDSLEKEIVAFLNYPEGGVIYLGIDKNGNVVGLEDADAVQLKVKDRLKNNIQPSCLGLFDVIHETSDGLDVVKIIVASGSEKNTGCLKRVAFFASAAQVNPCRYI